jgi:hypothetical protein
VTTSRARMSVVPERRSRQSSSGSAANPSGRASPKVRDAIGNDAGYSQGGGGLPVLLYVLMQRHCVSSFELGDGGGVAGVGHQEGVADDNEQTFSLSLTPLSTLREIYAG